MPLPIDILNEGKIQIHFRSIRSEKCRRVTELHWKKRPESTRKQENKRIVTEIKVIHGPEIKSHLRSSRAERLMGALEFTWISRKRGLSCSQKRVARLMRSHQIAAKRKRKFVVTTDSKHDLPVAENKLNQEFTATKANEKWVTDITYVWTREG